MFCEDWIELHGDRRGNDDQALIGGVGRLGDQPVVSSTPRARHEGERCAQLRDGHAWGLPNVRLMDAVVSSYRSELHRYPRDLRGLQAEEQGQGEGIAVNLREMFRLKVPVIATVIGEGGSGGALGIGVADRLLMFEHSVYTVAGGVCVDPLA